MFLLVALPSVALAGGMAGPPSAASLLSPIEPRVNGLLAADRVHTSFNVGAHSAEGITLSWHVNANASALGRELKVASFVVDLTGSLTGAAAADGAAPLSWSSGETQSTESSLQLPPSLVRRFSPGASFSFKVRLRDALTGTYSRRRDCHFTDTPSPSILERLLQVEGGAAE